MIVGRQTHTQTNTNRQTDRHFHHNTPLPYRGRSKTIARGVSQFLLLLLQRWAADYWVSLGASRDKLVVGMATYGRCFTLSNAADADIGAAAVGPCQPGTITAEPGFLAYYEVDIENIGRCRAILMLSM